MSMINRKFNKEETMKMNAQIYEDSEEFVKDFLLIIYRIVVRIVGAWSGKQTGMLVGLETIYFYIKRLKNSVKISNNELKK